MLNKNNKGLTRGERPRMWCQNCSRVNNWHILGIVQPLSVVETRTNQSDRVSVGRLFLHSSFKCAVAIVRLWTGDLYKWTLFQIFASTIWRISFWLQRGARRAVEVYLDIACSPNLTPMPTGHCTGVNWKIRHLHLQFFNTTTILARERLTEHGCDQTPAVEFVMSPNWSEDNGHEAAKTKQDRIDKFTCKSLCPNCKQELSQQMRGA
jgi:hypothetical protein